MNLKAFPVMQLLSSLSSLLRQAQKSLEAELDSDP